MTLTTNNMEVWKDINEYNGYSVSNRGRVKSMRKGKERILKPGTLKCGYKYVILYDSKQGRKLLTIHRLVANAFIENKDNKPFVNHKDEDKTNNDVNNLEWCDNRYNTNYGTRNEKLSKRHLNRKDESKGICQYDKLGNFIQEYPSAHEVQRKLGFYAQNIGKCCLGKRKTAYGYIWKFK